MAGVVELLAELVRINSTNASMPDGAGEAELGRYVADFGRLMGAEVRLEEVLPERSNVYVRLPASSGDAAEQPRRLLFDVHLDTVPLAPMPDALSPVVRDGRMWGRGACDTKGSLAAVLKAMERVAQMGSGRKREVLLLASVDEEFRKRGVTHAVQQGLTAEAAIVGEPTSMRPVVAHKGAVRWRFTTIGKAAHTSRPENGNNAILQMMEVIGTLEERVVPRLDTITHPLLTPPTLTVGRIEGGLGVNIVPERCWIEIDRRTLPTEDPDEVLAEIDAVMGDLMARRPDVRVERDAPFLSESGLETAPDAPVVRAVQAACRLAIGSGFDVSPAGVPYGTDGTALRGVPSVVIGPGDIAQAHSADEWVELAQVEAAERVYYEVMRGWVEGEW